MKITLSKSQWQQIGRKTGWIKSAFELPENYQEIREKRFYDSEQKNIPNHENKNLKPIKKEQNIAKTILQQLGGNKFAAMTGARNFLNIGNGLSFKLPGSGGFTKNGINYVKIILDPNDTYTVEFGRTRGTKYTVINKLNDIYCDQLQEIFKKETGLETHL